MLEIIGKVNTAICYAKVIEAEAVEQIQRMCDYEFTQGSKIQIMPDVHAGKGCTIGTTMTITDKAVPNIVGVDIGCGMYTVELGKAEIDFENGRIIFDYGTDEVTFPFSSSINCMEYNKTSQECDLINYDSFVKEDTVLVVTKHYGIRDMIRICD